MPAITSRMRKVYHAPTKRRDYLTREAAVQAEARAMIVKKYPTEKGDASDGYNQWHWTEDDRLRKVFTFLAKRIRNHSQTRKEAT